MRPILLFLIFTIGGLIHSWPQPVSDRFEEMPAHLEKQYQLSLSRPTVSLLPN